MERPPLVVLLLGFSSIYKNLVAAALQLWAILHSLRSLRDYSLFKNSRATRPLSDDIVTLR